MSFYGDHVYPHVNTFMAWYAGGIPGFAELLEPQYHRAQGTVLEVGIGTGATLEMFDEKKVERVIGLDPHAKLLGAAAKTARQVSFHVDLVAESAERISLPDTSVDTVLTTFVYCTIPDLKGALAEIARVLRPGGQVIFTEHGLGPEPHIQRRQRREEPVHKWLFQGCHLTREIPKELAQAGFAISELNESYFETRRLPRHWCYLSVGIAQRP